MNCYVMPGAPRPKSPPSPQDFTPHAKERRPQGKSTLTSYSAELEAAELESINPLETALRIRRLYKIVFGFIIIGLLYSHLLPIYDMINKESSQLTGIILSLFWMVVYIDFAIFFYFIVSRLTLAPLMSWHFNREMLIKASAILQHLESKNETGTAPAQK